MKAKTATLLPCPFCEGKAEYNDRWRAEFYGLDTPNVCCTECGVRNFEVSKEEAIKAWNTRKNPPMTKPELIEQLTKLATKAESKAELARRLGVSAAYLSDVFNGNREPGEKILNALKLERVVTYRRK